ncbi:hypothetical protein PZH32_00635 [Adlercreutzia equolifaciens]|uniref:hypothetical protein n=1 Tax=Adlercreutzia equolifaciens TaxID=446660 RepID=UPI0023AE9B72|nr:hypothetical protein [Adlercreutzia equolifaciens]MDE8701466.1 hypothetical protein [Adlercreutzia equolifaciens]
MSDHYLVNRDGATALSEIIAQTQQTPLTLSLDEVTVEIPGHPIEGENWAPQLAPFKPWVHDAALDERNELDGTDGDLLIVGALGMGISDEERESLIGDAVHGDGVKVAAEGGDESSPTAGMTPHQLWEAGLTPPWRGEEATTGVCPPAEGGQREDSRERELLVSTGVGTAADRDRETMDLNRETPIASRETPSEIRETILLNGVAGEGERFALNVPVKVREDGDGYALSAVHLSVLAEHGLPADNLVVVVPSFIGGRSVVRIASEAFARRFTSGVRVRLLVVPDSVEVVGAQAFGSVCAETIYLGRNVRTYDPAPLDMALPSPRLEARRYQVHPQNETFFVQDGCLLERMQKDTGSSRLLFIEAPYEEEVALPAGIRIMGAATLAKGCPPPRVLDAPLSLERVDGSVPPETLWRSDDPAALKHVVARCGGRVTDYQAVEQEECWYGFSATHEEDGLPDDVRTEVSRAMDGDACTASGAVGSPSVTREAHLVAGPPAPDSVSRRFSSAAHARVQGAATLSPREIAANAASAMVAPVSTADRLALPRAVEGAALTAIAERALITAPATLVIPETVRAIADGNTAKGTRKLMLSEGLQSIGAHCFCSRTLVGPVLIPSSVTSIGEGSFEYAVVRLAAADAVVHITSDQLISCFLTDAPDGIPFDFERYDAQLLAGRGLPDHLGALLHRLAVPFRLESAMAARIVDALRERATDAMAAVAREGDIAMVRALAEGGFLDDEALFERQIERLRASNRTDCVLYLMNWHRDRQEAARATAAAAKPQRARDRFAL